MPRSPDVNIATERVLQGYFSPLGVVAITPGASPYTYTAGETAEVIYITGGTVSAVAKNGVTIFTATPCTVHLGPNEQVTVTYSVVPTMNRDRK